MSPPWTICGRTASGEIGAGRKESARPQRTNIGQPAKAQRVGLKRPVCVVVRSYRIYSSLTPLLTARDFCGLGVYRCLGSRYRHRLSRLFPKLGQTLYENVADRYEKDADKGRDSHAKHNRSSHDAA